MKVMTIKECWLALLADAPASMPAEQVEQHRRFFYSGVFVMYAMTEKACLTSSKEECGERWTQWGEELKADGPLGNVAARQEADKLIRSLTVKKNGKKESEGTLIALIRGRKSNRH